ncbi:hypothetical protein [Sphingosinicella sp. BN140058]|uniref:hypothetical protein n=1 Tax=Sphingosinicella sp. BN140058 TaxID=1892855 RepID=UPI001011CD26|nr:hypothetical protein [Sphingosinicella sp. BN140058]QAY80356.1 hypothetical protein ETR14_27325 [Sphingosinicella sp. BN140058]
MFAYSPSRRPIIGSLERQHGEARAVQGSFFLDKGAIDFELQGRVEWYYDRQTATTAGEMIFIDDQDGQWLASQIILRDRELTDADELVGVSLPTPRPALATYQIALPANGLRSLESFSADERQSLRPIAETLAMLDGNAFFGAAIGDDGDDTWFHRYLPEAAALVASSPAARLASFMRGSEPLPLDGPLSGLIKPVEHHGGERVHDFTSGGPRSLYRVANIEWDLSDEDTVHVDTNCILTPHLPTSILVAVDRPKNDAEPEFADLLSDAFGYLIRSLSIQPVDEAATTAAHEVAI